ncbi:lysophospholipid acyltransferase family protein [Eionea flava]
MKQIKGRCLIIANHPSLIDVVLLFAVHKNLNCIVKGALWDNFFTGSVVRLAGFIPNNSAGVVSIAVEKLHAGENLLIFPEGSRSEDDCKFRFKRGASNVVVAADVAIMPVLIKCYPSALKKGQKWYIIPDGGAGFSLDSGHLLSLRECIDTTKPKTLQYRDLTQFLEDYYEDWFVAGSPPVPNKNL